MKTLTLRNIPPEVERLVEERVEERGMSYNQAVLSLLLERAGVSSGDRKRRTNTDLDGLIGVWSRKEGLDFERRLGEERKIDDELWS